MIAERAERAFMVEREIVQLQAFQRHDADDPVLTRERQWDCDLGSRLTPFLRSDRQIARITRHVADVDRLAFAPGGGSHAAVEGNNFPDRLLFRAVPDRLFPYQ